MQGFDSANPPFDRLTQAELHELTSAVDIGYFAPGEAIVRYEQASDRLHVVIKGSVEGRVGGGVQVVLGPKDTFDSRAVVHGSAGEDFVAAEETLCYLIPRDLVLRLIRQNPAFAAFFYADISRKLDAFADARKSEGVESVLRARVRDARCGRAVYVEGSASIAEAGRTMRDHAINALFVRDGERVGVVTGMNLSKAVVLRGLALDTPIREICHFDVVSIGTDDFIFDALLLMTRHDKRRLAVRSGDDYVGFLEDIDLLGLFAGNSQLIPGRIDRARDLDDLAGAARDIQAQVERLHRQGLKVGLIAEITSDLNRRLFAKLFDMTAAPSIRQHGCLLLMGSEGRGEQTIRTDQDNGLLLAREVPVEDLDGFRRTFSGALDAFGFQPCSGDVMVRNPAWSQPIDGFVRQLQSWVLRRDAEAAMSIAIFFDASAVAGNPALLSHAKRSLVTLLRGEQALLARFAHLIETFATPNVGMLSQLMSSVGVGTSEIDLKKAGIFPIVHAVRTLAIEREIFVPSTADRIARLVDAGALEPGFGREMVSALQIFMEYRLRSQLQALHRRRPEREVVLDLNEITAGDRDILRDALRIVRQVREIIRVRFNLAVF